MLIQRVDRELMRGSFIICKSSEVLNEKQVKFIIDKLDTLRFKHVFIGSTLEDTTDLINGINSFIDIDTDIEIHESLSFDDDNDF